MIKVFKKTPLISIIVPIYNVENYLERCINSLIAQTYKNIEIILVDDGSTDNSLNICNAYSKKDKRIKIIHQKNGGVSDARNKGISFSHGEYITFVDSDDYVSNDYVEYMYNMICKTGAKLSICRVKIIWKNTKKNDCTKEYFKTLNQQDAFENLLYQQGIEVAVYGKLYKKDLFDSIKFPKGEVYEDTAVIYKLIDINNKIAFGQKECYYYVARKGSISKHKFFNKNEEFYIKNTDNMLNYIVKKYPNLILGVKSYYVYSRFRILRMLLYTKPRNKKIESEIVKNIKGLSKDLIFSKKTPKRDKVAIILLYLGTPIFKFSWDVYCKLTGRIM